MNWSLGVAVGVLVTAATAPWLCGGSSGGQTTSSRSSTSTRPRRCRAESPRLEWCPCSSECSPPWRWRCSFRARGRHNPPRPARLQLGHRTASRPWARDSTPFSSHLVGLKEVLDPVLRTEHSLKFNAELVAAAVERRVLVSAP